MHEKLNLNIEADKPQDNCAVVGIFTKTGDVSKLLIDGLIELNHRGQEGSGIVVSNGEEFVEKKNPGLVETVFYVRDENGELIENFPRLQGSFTGIGHNRYSTSGTLNELQPFLEGGIAIAHNGNLTNVQELKVEFDLPDEINGARSDTRVSLAVVNRMEGTEEEKILAALKKFEGAYSFVFSTKDTLYASRDPHGFRPLILGKLDGGGYVVASETSALREMKAKFDREILPGETIKINEDGVTTIGIDERNTEISRCIFELIYLSRPDSIVFGIPVMEFRRRVGEALVKHLPEKVDVIAPVPDSGRGAWSGVISAEVARKSDALFEEVFYPNKYRNIMTGNLRTFISPNGRVKAATEKYSVIESNVRGKDIVLIDDSILRGSMKRIVGILKAHGARSVHALIAAPPIEHACGYGVDFGTDELVAGKSDNRPNNVVDIEKVKVELGLDSLYYISYAELLEAVLGNPVENVPEVFEQNKFCGACFTGRYPVPIDGTVSKIA